ncbi:MAG: hypothetical protein AAF957_26535 [Planctomycetota bacterium]
MGTPTRSEPRRDGDDAGRDPGWDPGCSPGWDPDRWWTIGEAADVAGVAHRQLADWASEGRLTVRNGWREGVEIRLVRAGDVAALAPDARANAAASRSELTERAVFTGPRRSALGASGATRPAASDGEHDRSSAGREAVAETEDWRVAMEREIERLRATLDASNAARATLDEELRAARQRSSPTRERMRASEAPAVAAPPKVHGPSRASTAAVAATFALLTGFLAGRLAAAPERATLAAAEPAIDAAPTAASLEDVVVEEPTALNPSQVPSPGPTPDPAWSTESAAMVIGSPTLPPAEFASSDADFVAAEDPPPLRFPLHWTDISEAPPAASVVPPCAVGERMHGELDVRRALGPCFGPPTADGLSVAGQHRVSGTECCAQHAFVERVAAGVTNPSRTAALLAEAAQAERDGLVPPLLVLRAERTAAVFVRACAGPWIAAGLDGPADADAGHGHEHVWSMLGEDEEGIRLQLTSWAQLAEDEPARPFRMELEVLGGPEGDVLWDFVWLDGR